MTLLGTIVAESDKELIIKVPKPFETVGKEVLVELDDGVTITSPQRRKVYVLLNFISEWSGYTPVETIKEMTKMFFAGWTGKLRRFFSLSNCSKETASDFITFLIDFCLVNQIPCNEPLQSLCEDLEKYMYSCLYNKRCCVCGKAGEIHHVDAVGMGNDRTKMYQIGMMVMPLCRKHHTEMHTCENSHFFKKYHVCSVPLTEAVGKVYRMSNKAIGKNNERQ